MHLPKAFFVLLLVAGFVVLASSVRASTATSLQAIAEVDITIRTHFWAKAGLNPADNSNWPEVALYINNGKSFDRVIDYGSCETAGSGCGTPNLYTDKLQNGILSPTATTQSLDTKVKVRNLVTQPDSSSADFFITKLSYVFFNDYWNPSTNPETNRDIGITKIEFFWPDGQLIETLTPNSLTAGVDQGSYPGLNGFYFDYGLVNMQGIQNEEQSGMVQAFDKKDSTIETDATKNAITQARAKGMWLLEKEGSLNAVTEVLAQKIIDKVPPPATPVPSPSPTPPSNSTTKIKAAPDGTLPWSNNAGQNRLGPTSAWTDPTSHIATICNGAWCWQSNFTTGALENNGNPVDIKTAFASTVQTTGEQSLWKNGGPLAGWEEYKNTLVSLSNQKYMWLWGSGGWANNGQAFDLSAQQYWKDTVGATDGTTLFSGSGITTAWTDKLNSREYLCNNKWCWVFNYAELRWHNQDSAGKGRPFDITSLFKIAPSSTGTTITTNGGPTVGWTNDVTNTSTICNEGFCWSYRNRSGTRPDLLDIAWERPNSTELGQAMPICEALGEDASTCAVPDTTPLKGDFDNNETVDIFDYNLLIPKWGSEFCEYNLAGTSCMIDSQDVAVFITQFGASRATRN